MALIDGLIVSLRSSARFTAVAVALLLGGHAAGAEADAPGGIYSCTDDKGRRLTSDRPIPECTGKEQRVLNRDGSLKGLQPPTLTAEERAEYEARERRAAQIRMAQAEVVRRDRNLLSRYQSEAPHQQAREAALDAVKVAMKASEQRLKELSRERSPLLDEAEFYKGKTLPLKLKTALESNDTAVEAQRLAMSTQEAELGRVNRLYDIELERLRKLWAGAKPGSLGPLPNFQGEMRTAAPAVVTTR